MTNLCNSDITTIIADEGCVSPIVVSPYNPIKIIRVVVSRGSQGLRGPAGPPGGGLGYEIAATFATISSSIMDRLIRVSVDETNDGDKSLYLYTTGIGIEFLQTIA